MDEPATAPLADGVKFDLQPLAKAFDSAQLLPRRIMLLLFTGLGGVLLLAAVALTITDATVVGLISLVLVFALGAVILGAGVMYVPRATRGAAELRVGADGLRLKRLDGRWFSVLWSDYRNEVLIVDARGLPVDRKVPVLRSAEFIFNAVYLPVQGPIPLQAVYSIMGSARSSGLTVLGWSETPTLGGAEIEISIPKGVDSTARSES